MKHRNLQILRDNGFPVPPFVTLGEGEATDLSFSRGERFAVRSSVAGEDSQDHSFAGQFDTFLNVPREQVAAAVEQVRRSAEKQNVRDYLTATGQSGSGSVCVIVQEMVSPDFSGVMFTANPRGILNETVITVGKGLGDGVVEDRVDTTSYFYNNDDGIYVLQQQPEGPLLGDDLLRELIETGHRIRALFGYEADVEFALENGKLWLLQVRPITTLPKCDPIILDNSNIVESYPGVSLPLTQDFAKIVYSGVFINCVRRLTGDENLVRQMTPCLQEMVASADWRIYYRINNWYEILRLLPFSKRIIPIWQRMLGFQNTQIPKELGISVSKKTKATIFCNFIKYLLRTPKHMDRLNRDFNERYMEYRRKADECQTIAECLALFYYIHDDIMADWDITLVNDMYTFLFTAFAGKRNSHRIADVRNLESMKPVMAMNALMDLAGREGVDSPRYLQAQAQYLERYGDRCLGELKMETVTYRVDPRLLRHQVQTGRYAAAAPAPAAKWEGPFVKRAKLGIRNREISRMNRSRLFGISRQLFRTCGEILTRNGQLECAQDVFYLYMEELTGSADYRQKVLTRKAEEQRFAALPTFGRLVYASEIFNHSIDGQGQALHQKNLLTGIPTSAGVIEAEVLVVEQPEHSMDTTGKILVARSTDPGWVFLLQNAAGIIAERGSLLSHTAIISRELHKPAVVNVRDCTKILKTGDRVRLDASEGTVTLL